MMDNVTTKQQAIAEAEACLIRQIRLRKGASRVELARYLNLAPSTVGLYVDRLIDGGFLQKGRKARRASGRPPTILELNPKAGEFIGVDFDARQMAVVSVDFAQRTQEQRVLSIRATDTTDQVVKKIQQTVAALARRRPLLGIGLAVPGTVDSRHGVGVHYEYIRGWKDVPLVEHLAKRFRVPIYLENNIRAMALAEQWFGEGRSVDNFVCLGIRSGIGAGVIIDGRLHRGHDGLAGEIGGWPCEALTLEEVASVRAILAQLTEAVREGRATSLTTKRNKVTLEGMLRAASESDPLVMQVLERAANAVGRVVDQLSRLLNPQRVIVAGPLAELSEAFLKPVAANVKRLATPLHEKPPEIIASGFGVFGGALGAAALAVHKWKPS